MKTEPRLESYLASLDRALSPLPFSERAEIVTEIKSHIREARARDPEKDLESVLASFGDPDVVASQYVSEQGEQARRPEPRPAGASPRGQFAKWMAIALLGSFALFLLFMALIAWKFSSWITSKEGRNGESVLSALMDMDSKGSARFKLGNRQMFTGRRDFDPTKYDQLGIQFTNAKLEVSTSRSNQLLWECAYLGSSQSSLLKEDPKTKALLFTLGQVAAVECELEVPVGMRVTINGANAQIDFDEPRFDLDVRVTNGQIEFDPDDRVRYNYDVKVTNGAVDAFTSTGQGKDAHQIMIRLTNGQVEKLK